MARMMLSLQPQLNSSVRPSLRTIHGVLNPYNLALPTTLLHLNLRPSSFRTTTASNSASNQPISTPSAIETNQSEQEENYRVLTATKTEYNTIIILESQASKILLLDDTQNIHSIFHKSPSSKWTNSYWDEFVSLPPIIPTGPIAIFGLAGGTAARLLLNLWPHLQLYGWELDDILIDKAREHFELSELEKLNRYGGVLHVCIGDALSELAKVDGGYAGIVVDLFCDGKVLGELEETETWVDLYNKLTPNGRIMVNCGGASKEGDGDGWERNGAIQALCRAVGAHQVNWKNMDENGNYLALTGKLPDSSKWASEVPDQLSISVKQWQPCVPKS